MGWDHGLSLAKVSFANSVREGNSRHPQIAVAAMLLQLPVG